MRLSELIEALTSWSETLDEDPPVSARLMDGPDAGATKEATRVVWDERRGRIFVLYDAGHSGGR